MAKSRNTAELVKHAKLLNYSEELRTPFQFQREMLARALEGAGPDEEQLRWATKDWESKLQALFRHYRISGYGKYQRLLAAVLRDWVPGFSLAEPFEKPARGIGRPPLTEHQLIDIYEKIEKLRLQHRPHTIGDACKRFKRQTKSELAIGTIRNQYRAGEQSFEERQRFFGLDLNGPDRKGKRTKSQSE